MLLPPSSRTIICSLNFSVLLLLLLRYYVFDARKLFLFSFSISHLTKELRVQRVWYECVCWCACVWMSVINCVAYKRLLVAMAGMTSNHKSDSIETHKNQAHTTIACIQWILNRQQHQRTKNVLYHFSTNIFFCCCCCWCSHIKLSIFDLFSVWNSIRNSIIQCERMLTSKMRWFFELKPFKYVLPLQKLFLLLICVECFIFRYIPKMEYESQLINAFFLHSFIPPWRIKFNVLLNTLHLLFCHSYAICELCYHKRFNVIRSERARDSFLC